MASYLLTCITTWRIMHLYITITEDDVVYIEGTTDDGTIEILTRIDPDTLNLQDYRKVKPKRWWNL